MAKQISVDEAIKRAESAQHARMEAIKVVAQSRSALAEGRDRLERELAELTRTHAQILAELERHDSAAYSDARQAGWSDAELTKIGFTKPTVAVARRPRKTTINNSEGAHE